MANFIPIEHSRKKLYEKEVNSKGFKEMDEDTLAEVAKKVYKKQENNFVNPFYLNNSSKLENYDMTLRYLTNPYIHLQLRTFDERIAFLIMMTDPYLETYKEYLKTDLISNDTIEEEKDINERIRLRRERNEALSDFQSRVRDKIGFYDSKLLKYELLFFNKFYSDKELVTDVKMNNQDDLISMSKFLKNFNSISDERYEELVKIAQACLASVDGKYSIPAAAFNVANQKKLLGIKGIAEQCALFILLTDSELEMLSIFEDECRIPIIEERIKEEFGYYNPDLLILERKFHKRFCPNKELSIWAK